MSKNLYERLQARDLLGRALENGNGKKGSFGPALGFDVHQIADSIEMCFGDDVTYIVTDDGKGLFDVESMSGFCQEIDKELASDINDLFRGIDLETVEDILSLSKYCRSNARTRCYEEIAQLGALYALRDAFEESYEDAEFYEVFNLLTLQGEEALVLPEKVIEQCEDTLNALDRIVEISLIARGWATERDIDECIGGWASLGCSVTTYEKSGLDAFELHCQPSLYISFINRTWVFSYEHQSDVCEGSQPESIECVLGRFLDVYGFEF